jgi:hypothetical protein
MKPNEQNTDDYFGWPNEKMLWYRLIACVAVGACAAIGVVMLLVMVVNAVMEK